MKDRAVIIQYKPGKLCNKTLQGVVGTDDLVQEVNVEFEKIIKAAGLTLMNRLVLNEVICLETK